MIVVRAQVLRVASALLIVFLFTVGLHQLRLSPQGAPDFSCNEPAGQAVSIDVSTGATGADIGRLLYANKVIKSSESFFRIAVSDPRSSSIAPGRHQIDQHLCAKDALEQLLDGSRISGLIKIFEGAWNVEIVDQMVKAGFVKSEVKVALAAANLPQGITSIEGILFPAQYSFAQGTTAADAIASMITRGKSEFEKIGIFSAPGRYSAQDLVTMASIIQAEGDERDFSKVSRVIRNRLEIGMPLQMDSTVHYIKSTRGKIFLSTESTLLRSPYNTYRNYGLPPGPIGNPGSAALVAALDPAVGDWIYFITVAPGDTRFTASNSQFSEWKLEYKRNLKDGLFSRSKK